MAVPATERQRLSSAFIVRNQFDVAADLVGLDAAVRKLLKTPFRTVAVQVPGPARAASGFIRKLTNRKSWASRRP
jgi:hypothetical protein